MTYLVTPSKPDYWHGTPAEGPYTREQQAKLLKLGRKWRGERFDVKIRLQKHEPLSFMVTTTWTTHPCPLLFTTKTGRKVITPSGMETWVNREGKNA